MSIDQTASDFDGVTFHISTPETKTKIMVSIQIRCFQDLLRYGADKVLNREYGPYVVPPEPGFDFSIVVDLTALPESQEEREALVNKIALLKRNIMAAPFEQAYEEHYQLKAEAAKFSSEEAPQGVREGGEVKAIHYREEEAIYIKASHDRVTVIFSTVFREETDRIFGKVFIQEFVDARRRAIQNAPQVLFRNDPPLELQGVPGVRNTGTGEIGYVTFGTPLSSDFMSRSSLDNSNAVTVLFPRHLTPQRMPEVISHLQTFRDYFHYHIKASKVRETYSALYTRMKLKIRQLRLISTRVCGGGQQTSSKVSILISQLENYQILTYCQFCAERGLTTRRRSARQPAGGPSRLEARRLLERLQFQRAIRLKRSLYSGLKTMSILAFWYYSINPDNDQADARDIYLEWGFLHLPAGDEFGCYAPTLYTSFEIKVILQSNYVANATVKLSLGCSADNKRLSSSLHSFILYRGCYKYR